MNQRENERLRKNIGEIIRYCRFRKKLGQMDFAHKFGLSQSVVSRIESGSIDLAAFLWLDICQAEGLDPMLAFVGLSEEKREAMNAKKHTNRRG